MLFSFQTMGTQRLVLHQCMGSARAVCLCSYHAAKGRGKYVNTAHSLLYQVYFQKSTMRALLLLVMCLHRGHLLCLGSPDFSITCCISVCGTAEKHQTNQRPTQNKCYPVMSNKTHTDPVTSLITD